LPDRAASRRKTRDNAAREVFAARRFVPLFGNIAATTDYFTPNDLKQHAQLNTIFQKQNKFIHRKNHPHYE
jgi:hypothetical protein